MQHRTAIPRVLIKAGLLLLLSALLLTSATYAWLRVGFVTPDTEISFTTDKLTPPPVNMWIYTEEDENENLAAENRWVEQSVTTDGSANTAPGVISSVTDGKYTFTLTSLHLGTVDNLIMLDDDNYVYLRVQIDPAALGDSVDITLALQAENGITMYDSTGTLVTDGVGAGAKTPLADLYDVNETTPLLLIDYAISKTAYTPYTMDTLAPELKASFATVEPDTTYTAPDDDSYYIYLRVHPNLAAFMEATRFLYEYMPCTLLYSLDISVMIYETAV